MTNKHRILAAIAGFAAFGALQSAPTFAAEPEMEQCAGVIRGGKNDCATSKNACHGHVAEDSNPEAWIYLPKGTCDRIAGARVVHVVDPSPKKK